MNTRLQALIQNNQQGNHQNYAKSLLIFWRRRFVTELEKLAWGCTASASPKLEEYPGLVATPIAEHY